MDEAEETNEKPWQAKLRHPMMEEAGLTPKQSYICMQHIMKTFKDRVMEEVKRVAMKVFTDEVEAAKYRKSRLMHKNADKCDAGDQLTAGNCVRRQCTGYAVA